MTNPSALRHSGLPEINAADLSEYQKALEEGRRPRGEASDALISLRLLHPVSEGSDVYVPVSPSSAAEALVAPLEQKQLELRSMINGIRSTLAAFEAVHSEVRSKEAVPLTLLTGGPVISTSVASSVRNSTREILTVQPGGSRPPELVAETIELNLALLAKGIRQRTLYQHSIRKHPVTMAYCRQVIEAGAEVRTVTEIFERLIICDDTVAYIPTSDLRANEALEIRHPALIRFMRAGFERSWEGASPIPANDPRLTRKENDDAVLLRIAELLVEGHTDESISQRLGMGGRTVAKRISALSLRLGSRSRGQLGYLIARSGMLDETGPDPSP
ncbi:LuxR family transcriptional regulator [Streptomyces sp. NPDC006482]|uniref:LuxR family transcriptional regulator n=1 Tax=Streptomyces sp. NPDC006482 TaxID=3154306 RepID=UPI0033A951A9